MHAPALRHAMAARLRMVCVLATALACPAARGDVVAAEGTVKMAFVYNFGKFVEWPGTALPAVGHPFTLCTLGSVDSLAPGLAAIEGKSLQGRGLHIQRLARGADLAGCQILYMGEADAATTQRTLSAAHALSILTVSDTDEFAENGGVVGLVVEANKVQFKVNLHAARQANLRISSDLLKFARAVIGKERS